MSPELMVDEEVTQEDIIDSLQNVKGIGPKTALAAVGQVNATSWTDLLDEDDREEFKASIEEVMERHYVNEDFAKIVVLGKAEEHNPEWFETEEDGEPKVIEYPNTEFEVGDICRHHENTHEENLIRVSDVKYSLRHEEWDYLYEYVDSHTADSLTIQEFEYSYEKLLTPECPACNTRGDYYGSEVFCPKTSCGVEKYNGEFESETAGGDDE